MSFNLSLKQLFHWFIKMGDMDHWKQLNIVFFNKPIKGIFKGENKVYKLGCYTENGEMEVLRTVDTRIEAKEKYKILHDSYKCTIWIQKIEFVNPEDL